MSNKEIVTENVNQEENLTTSIYHDFKKMAGRVILGLLIVNVVLGIASASAYLLSNVRWMELFESYDFISQDGEGINNVNGGTQGDLLNGSESEVEEGQVER